MKSIGVIPSRYGSTRFRGKALADIEGKTMVRRVYEQACKAKLLDGVIVATDDVRIKEEVERFGGKVVMTSPDHPSGTDRVAEAVRDIDVEIVVNVQGDQPFIDPVMIDEVTLPMIEDPSIEMATLMYRVGEEYYEDPSVVKVVTDRNGFALYFSRSLIPYLYKDKNFPVYEHVGLYAYRKDFLLKLTGMPPTPLERVESLEQLRVLENGFRIKVIETKCPDTELSGMSIDTVEDLERARELMRRKGVC